MIINKDILRENKNFVSETKTPIMVLDLKHFQYYNDVERFGLAVEILNVVNSVTWLNKICSDLNSKQCIDTSVFYEIIECLFAEKCLEDSKLKTYFEIQQDLEHFSKIFQKVADTDRNFDLPFEVDFILLGVNLEKYQDMEEDAKADLHDEYIVLFSKVRNKDVEVGEFISKAKELLCQINEFELEAML